MMWLLFFILGVSVFFLVLNWYESKHNPYW